MIFIYIYVDLIKAVHCLFEIFLSDIQFYNVEDTTLILIKARLNNLYLINREVEL